MEPCSTVLPFFAVSETPTIKKTLSNTYCNLNQGKWQLAIKSVGFRFNNQFFDRQLPIVLSSNIVRGEEKKKI